LIARSTGLLEPPAILAREPEESRKEHHRRDASAITDAKWRARRRFAGLPQRRTTTGRAHRRTAIAGRAGSLSKRIFSVSAAVVQRAARTFQRNGVR
jgi:hypothetical protein